MEHAGTRGLSRGHGAAAYDVFAAADYVLAGRILSGDADALGEMFDRHAGTALAAATALVGDAAVAEDVVHDAFVAAWQKMGQFDSSRDTLGSWVLALTRQHAARRVRTD